MCILSSYMHSHIFIYWKLYNNETSKLKLPRTAWLTLINAVLFSEMSGRNTAHNSTHVFHVYNTIYAVIYIKIALEVKWTKAEAGRC